MQQNVLYWQQCHGQGFHSSQIMYITRNRQPASCLQTSYDKAFKVSSLSLFNELILVTVAWTKHAKDEEEWQEDRKSETRLKDGRTREGQRRRRERRKEEMQEVSEQHTVWHADRWQPRCIATEAHTIVVNRGRASHTHASTVDTSLHTQAGREAREGEGTGSSAACDRDFCPISKIPVTIQRGPYTHKAIVQFCIILCFKMMFFVTNTKLELVCERLNVTSSTQWGQSSGHEPKGGGLLIVLGAVLVTKWF